MTFLNLILLGGAAAFSLPLLIHLLNRSRHRVIPWGAMHLLDASWQKNRRRLQLEQLILLLLRCAIPVILALCMARPVLTRLQGLLGDARSAVVILLDNSYSMDAGDPGNTPFQRGRAIASELISSLGRGSEVTVVPMAATTELPMAEGLSFDLARAARGVESLDAGFGRAELPRSLEIASDLLARSRQPAREILVISDFQRVSWSDDDAAARKRVREALDRLPIKPTLTLLDVSPRTEPDNISVEGIELSQLVFGVKQPVQFRATIRNHGTRPWPELRVYLRVDGEERGASQVNLGAREQTQVLFTHTFDQPGSHVIEVQADADPLQADNVFRAAIPVWDTVPVLLVSGDPRPEPLRGETDFLEIALQPFRSGRLGLADLITPRVIRPDELRQESFAGIRVLVLANVRDLKPQPAGWVRDFVRVGGGLLVLAGDRMEPSWWNREFASGNQPLLPLAIAGLGGSLTSTDGGTRVLAQHFAHPALALFNDRRNGDLSDAEVRVWFRLRPIGAAADPAVSVLAQLDAGDPFLAERQFGEGRVIQCAIPADADWSNWPARPVYLPLMQRLVIYLASSVYPPRNVEVGRPIIAFLPTGDAGRKSTLVDPAGRRLELAAVKKGARAVVEHTDTRRPGLYLLTLPDRTTIHYVVNTSRGESELAVLSPEERAAVAESLGASLVNSPEAYRRMDRERRFGREIWHPLLGLVLVALFAELWLQQRFARAKS